MTKANKLGVKIIGEADFERIIAGEAVGEKEHYNRQNENSI